MQLRHRKTFQSGVGKIELVFRKTEIGLDRLQVRPDAEVDAWSRVSNRGTVGGKDEER